MSTYSSEILGLALPPLATVGNGTGTQLPDYIGYIATAISVLFYGSNYVPVKKFETHDGMFFQFFLCLGIWTVGMAVNAARAFPTFHPVVMLGGAIWTFGNLFVVAIIQTIGMGLGILIWGIFNMLTGWATGRFGLLGIPAQVPSSIAFNYAGVGISAVASVLFFFVKPEVTPATGGGGGIPELRLDGESGASAGWRQDGRRSLSDQEGSISVYEDVFGSLDGAGGPASSVGGHLYPSLNSRDAPSDKLPIVVDTGSHSNQQQQQHEQQYSSDLLPQSPFWMKMTPMRRRIFGIALAVMIGPMFGVGFVPTYYVQSHVSGASENGLDYVFSHFTGIFVASIFFLLVYTMATRNRPVVNPRLIFPATVSGVMWGVAGASWFLANQVLSESISYPIISTAPAIVAAVWSVFVFREIRGVRNLVLLSIAITLSATGSVVNGLSKS